MDLLMSRDELEKITGGYTQPAKVLAELHEQGFFRARRSKVDGSVILERAHYDAIVAGNLKPGNSPKVRPAPRRVHA
ncbi:hypothetical protein BH09PSE5_BH09PSE5_08450 [soil metagenome]